MRFLMGFLQIGERRSAGDGLRPEGAWVTPCGGWVTPCGGMGYAPAMQAGERAPLGLRGLGEDFDFSP